MEVHNTKRRYFSMKIIKRNGAEMIFDNEKIFAAIAKANAAVDESDRISEKEIKRITDKITERCEKLGRAVSVEEVQDMVEREIMATGAFALAKTYITYRYTRELVRKSNTTDDKIISLIECNNEEVKQENSNKNPTVDECLCATVRNIKRLPVSKRERISPLKTCVAVQEYTIVAVPPFYSSS